MAKKKAPASKGRPTDYTPELAAKICQELGQGKSLRSVCASEDMPAASSVFLWLSLHKDFSEQYARAKEESADAMYEELSELGDEAINMAHALRGPQAAAVVQAVKLKADNLKWAMSKMKPKKYGDRITHAGDDTAPVAFKVVKFNDGENPPLPVPAA